MSRTEKLTLVEVSLAELETIVKFSGEFTTVIDFRTGQIDQCEDCQRGQTQCHSCSSAWKIHLEDEQKSYIGLASSAISIHQR